MSIVKSSMIERILAGAGLLLGSAGVALVAYFDPSKNQIFPVCPLHFLTGYSCPGCGLTRGFHALFHGDLVTALMYNAMLPVYFLIILYIGYTFVMIVFRGRAMSNWAFSPKLVYVFLIASLVFAILRNIPLYPFNLFSH